MLVLEKVVRLMAEKYKNIKFIIPTIENLASEIRKITAHWEQKPIIVTQKSQKILSYYSSNVAIAASGTVALELARVGLPFVVIYKISAITYFIVKFLIRAPNVCLINILAKRYDIVPELLQEDCTAENIFRAVENVLSPKESQRQKKSFHDVMKVLRSDPLKAAREVLNKIC
jgi:lipid-A-disaccharide synthase